LGVIATVFAFSALKWFKSGQSCAIVRGTITTENKSVRSDIFNLFIFNSILFDNGGEVTFNRIFIKEYMTFYFKRSGGDIYAIKGKHY
jgi:hypothetical protein